MNTGDRIKKRRVDLGISAEKLGHKIGVAKTTIYRYEQNIISKIPADTLDAIAVALRTTPDYLLCKKENPDLDSQEPAKNVGKSHFMSLMYDSEEYQNMIDRTSDIIKAIQKNPQLSVLFDKSGKLTPTQVDVILRLVDEILKEKDDN